MKLYEFTGTWKIDNGYQVSYIYCNAKNRREAEKIIRKSVPFRIDIDEMAKYNYTERYGNDVTLWYFDSEGKEHHDTYKGVRI